MASAKKSKAEGVTKKDFILQQGNDLPAKEVVENAAAQGIELTEKHVHVVRSAAKSKPKGKGKGKRAAKQAKQPAKAKKGAKGRTAKPKGEGVSKSDFIRSLPADLPAKEVVEKAAAQGIKITDKYVYVIRSAAKTAKAAKLAKAAPKTSGVKGRKAAAREGGADALEAALRKAIAGAGLVRSREILKEVESAFDGQ